VAIKLILPESEELEHEMAELVAATSLHHQHLVRYFHVGTTVLLQTKLIFIVMELAESSLQDELATTRLPAREVLRLAEHLAESLAFLHTAQLTETLPGARGSVCVHRDLKPANVLRVDGVWKLADLGLVRMLAESKGLTQTQRLMGTPLYMPPESFDGMISPAWDIWSLGAVLIEASTGVALWDFRLERELLNAIKTKEPRIPDDLPVPIGEIVRGCLVRDYRLRWRAEQVVEKLRAHREAEKQKQVSIGRISLLSMSGNVSRAGGNRYRFQIRIEANNDSNCTLGWSGLTINVPTINSRGLYTEVEIQMSSVGCTAPFKHGPGDEIFGFLDDGTFGRKQAESLFMESVREHWPPQERIVLEAVLFTSSSRLEAHLRVWSNRPTVQGEEAFGDPDWKTAMQKDQQGIPAYRLSLGYD
jgi:serine/threonine protein kinase